MATILLSAAGSALGSGIGGSILGLSGAVIGRAIGATAGRAIDNRILGLGSEPVETGRIERFRLTGASEGAPIAEPWGRLRLSGNVIWSTQFLETALTTGGGKGSPSPKSTGYTYSISLAIALCEGVAACIGRIWADGNEISASDISFRFYNGSESQSPDPKIVAVEGIGNAPSYRGTCYIVIEDLNLSLFGNRVPQFSFEVTRRTQSVASKKYQDLAQTINAVSLIPGTGEYAIATTPVYFTDGLGRNRSANSNSISGVTDLVTSLDQLYGELPNVGSVSLVVSWFGNDLRCSSCLLKPKVEQAEQDGVGMPWLVSGVTRQSAAIVETVDGRPVYGGTPADQSVIEAIVEIKAGGKDVMFYPFILMEQLENNGLPDPWSDSTNQPVLPWRGRITLDHAPGRSGSSDGTVQAISEVNAFLGTAVVSDFMSTGGQVLYTGPSEWKYRRFILHYAHLCVAAGGVESFCIGSELRSLTQIRSGVASFPMVQALIALAADVKSILGPSTKISYAADWSEYFGYQFDGNVYFQMDSLWSSPNIDFIGIDNYMPLSDWREGTVNADASWGSIYNIEYLKSNVAGGEGYDWFYDSAEARDGQFRTEISDDAFGEPWVFRYKDISSWWRLSHHERINGIRNVSPTAWIPESKPIRFTEYGCAAIDKGTNQPNLFIDSKSSESALPQDSNGHRDDFIQMQYLRAMHEFWSEPLNNRQSSVFAGSMLDLARCHVWAWDSRPFPTFPNNSGLWSDGGNYQHGHWINGRSTSIPVAAIIQDICDGSAIPLSSAELCFGTVRGYSRDSAQSARSVLQPISSSFAIDAHEIGGILSFESRNVGSITLLDPNLLVAMPPNADALIETRGSANETIDRLRVDYIEAEGSFKTRTAESIVFGAEGNSVSKSEIPMAVTGSEARGIADRWIVESIVNRDTIRFGLPKSRLDVGVGSIVETSSGTFRVDRLDISDYQILEAVRIDAGAYTTGPEVIDPPINSPFAPATPVFPLMLDLPLITGDELPYSPFIAVTAEPWLGSVSVWTSATENGFVFLDELNSRSTIGVTETVYRASYGSGVWNRGAALRVRLSSGQLSSVSQMDVLNGLNVAAIGNGGSENWEVIQFANATLVAPNTYELSVFLRGQSGTDGAAIVDWPIGSYFVLLNGLVPQVEIPSATRGLSRFYRFGIASKGYDDRNVVSLERTFDGIGLRPYSVAHLDHQGRMGEDVVVAWTRRTRIDGDSWQSFEVPLGESSEKYQITVSNSSGIRRQAEAVVPSWTYTASMQIADGVAGAVTINVAQFSDQFGPGPFKTISVS